MIVTVVVCSLFMFYLGIGTGLYLVARRRRKYFPISTLDKIGVEFMLFLELAIFWLLILAFGLGIPELTGTEKDGS